VKAIAVEAAAGTRINGGGGARRALWRRYAFVWALLAQEKDEENSKKYIGIYAK
jgi:hypothetical protein